MISYDGLVADNDHMVLRASGKIVANILMTWEEYETVSSMGI